MLVSYWMVVLLMQTMVFLQEQPFVKGAELLMVARVHLQALLFCKQAEHLTKRPIHLSVQR